MAITRINLSDQITTIVLKSNDISDVLGDPVQLVTGDSNVVDAINTIRDIVAPFDDSAEIIRIGRHGFSAIKTSGFGNVSYDSDTGQFSYVGPDSAELRLLFSGDSAIAYNNITGQFSMVPNALDGSSLLDSSLTSRKFANKVTLRLKTSVGSTVKTLYSPGS